MDSLKQGCNHGDFSFAFDNSNFSDRLLRICIFPDPIESTMFPERVKTLHVASSILAARSPFFYKLFANGMRESEQYDVILWINASEETDLMELLKFMYSNNLTVTNALDVLDVLVAADKYDVASCMRHCSRLLKNLPIMTLEFVVAYLDLPSHIIMAEALQPLTINAKQYYVVQYKDITKFEDEILNLSLDDVETIIASDNLQVTSEYCVYLFVLKWARYQYPKPEDRRKIIMTRLAKFIRYPYLTHKELLEFLKCNEFEPSFAVSVMREAIDFKEIGIDPKDIAEDESHRFVEREGYKRPSSVQVCYQLTWFINVVRWVSKGFVLMMKRVLGGDQVTLAMQMGLYGLY